MCMYTRGDQEMETGIYIRLDKIRLTAFVAISDSAFPVFESQFIV